MMGRVNTLVSPKLWKTTQSKLVDCDPTPVNFKAIIGKGELEKLIDDNDLMEQIAEQAPLDDGTWRFCKILAHHKPRNKKERWQVFIKGKSGQ